MKPEEELREAFVRIKNFVEAVQELGLPVKVQVTLQITIMDRSTRIEVKEYGVTT